MQIPLSGYGGRSELRIMNMPLCANHENLYYHSVCVDSVTRSAVISAVVGNRGSQTAFVNAFAFTGIGPVYFPHRLFICFKHFYSVLLCVR